MYLKLKYQECVIHVGGSHIITVAILMTSNLGSFVYSGNEVSGGIEARALLLTVVRAFFKRVFMLSQKTPISIFP